MLRILQAIHSLGKARMQDRRRERWGYQVVHMSPSTEIKIVMKFVTKAIFLNLI
jgi:hypothetical protein